MTQEFSEIVECCTFDLINYTRKYLKLHKIVKSKPRNNLGTRRTHDWLKNSFPAWRCFYCRQWIGYSFFFIIFLLHLSCCCRYSSCSNSVVALLLILMMTMIMIMLMNMILQQHPMPQFLLNSEIVFCCKEFNILSHNICNTQTQINLYTAKNGY